ncbi:MAG TPA: hypothetical protein DCQ79_12920, partial [Rhizobiales bacterium]|nr:hypothetical protein [Hyphomicrobiales bacterium]
SLCEAREQPWPARGSIQAKSRASQSEASTALPFRSARGTCFMRKVNLTDIAEDERKSPKGKFHKFVKDISIALGREGEIVAGLIFNPANQETFTAERGKGAYLNDRRRLRVAARTELSASVIGTGIPHSGRAGHDLFLKELRAVMAASAGVRRMGAAALDLAWTAAGRLDGFWERGLHPWDLAAGMIILREAGGYVTDADGRDGILTKGSVVAGNEAIHRGLLKLLKTAGAETDLAATPAD